MQRRDVVRAAALFAAGGAASAWAGAVHAQAAPPRAALPASFSFEDMAHAQKLIELGRVNDKTGGLAWTLLQQLCNDVGARPAGSAGDAKAAAWAQTQMRALGLQNVRAESFPLRVWQRGAAAAQLIAPQALPLVMTALGNSVAAPAGGITAEVAWYPDIDALKADTSDKARGRIVFIDQKTERFRDGRGYGVAVQARFAGPTEAAKRGALAVAMRSIGTDQDNIAHTGATRYEVGVPRIPAFAVAVPDAQQMAAMQNSGQTLKMQFTLDAKSDVEATSQNVIGEITGSELPDEIVALGAHLDSWDLGVGAQDDGAGVAIVMAAAALVKQGMDLTKKRPRRTVRVVLYGNEENGFDGAMAYGDRYKTQTHQLISESDFGAGRIWQAKARVQPAAQPLAFQMTQALLPLGVAIPAKGFEEGQPGPDAALLMRRHRWPAFQLSQDGTHYFDIHHTVHDTLSRIDPATLPQNVAAWAVVAWLAAQSPLPFGPPTL
jgi:carboxypeptidase Q